MQIHKNQSHQYKQIEQQYSKQTGEILNLFLEIAENGDQPMTMMKLKKSLRQAQKSLIKLDECNTSGDLKQQIWQQQQDVLRTMADIEISSTYTDDDDEEEFIYVGSRYHLINMIVLLLIIVILSSL